MSKVANIGSALMRGVRLMDAEARTLINDAYPAGLYGYTAHRKSNSRKYEDVWTARLAEILTASGIAAESQVPYPNQRRKKCDLLVHTSDAGCPIWIEFKTAWKSWFNRWDGIKVVKNSFYLPYLYGPLRTGLQKTHSAAQDILKLQKLLPVEANVGFLLVGFDSADAPMANEVDVLWGKLALQRYVRSTRTAVRW